MVSLEVIDGDLGLAFDLNSDGEDVGFSLLPKEFDFIFNVDVDLKLGTVDLSVTAGCEDTNLELNPDVDVNGFLFNLEGSIVVEFGNNLKDPCGDSNSSIINFPLSVDFKIADQRSPVMDDTEFFSGIKGSPPDCELMDV